MNESSGRRDPEVPGVMARRRRPPLRRQRRRGPSGGAPPRIKVAAAAAVATSAAAASAPADPSWGDRQRRPPAAARASRPGPPAPMSRGAHRPPSPPRRHSFGRRGRPLAPTPAGVAGAAVVGTPAGSPAAAAAAAPLHTGRHPLVWTGRVRSFSLAPVGPSVGRHGTPVLTGAVACGSQQRPCPRGPAAAAARHGGMSVGGRTEGREALPIEKEKKRKGNDGGHDLTSRAGPPDPPSPALERPPEQVRKRCVRPRHWSDRSLLDEMMPGQRSARLPHAAAAPSPPPPPLALNRMSNWAGKTRSGGSDRRRATLSMRSHRWERAPTRGGGVLEPTTKAPAPPLGAHPLPGVHTRDCGGGARLGGLSVEEPSVGRRRDVDAQGRWRRSAGVSDGRGHLVHAREGPSRGVASC